MVKGIRNLKETTEQRIPGKVELRWNTGKQEGHGGVGMIWTLGTSRG